MILLEYPPPVVPTGIPASPTRRLVKLDGWGVRRCVCGCGQPIVLVARGDTAGATVVFRNVLAATDPTFSATAPNWGGLVARGRPGWARPRLGSCPPALLLKSQAGFDLRKRSRLR